MRAGQYRKNTGRTRVERIRTRVIVQKPFKTADEAIKFLEQTREFLLFHKSVQNTLLNYDVYVFQMPTMVVYRSIGVTVKLNLNGREIVLRKDITDENPEFNEIVHKFIMNRASLDMNGLGKLLVKMFSDFLTESMLGDRQITDMFFKALTP